MTFALGGVPHAGPQHQYPAKVLLNFPKLNKLLFLCVTFLQALLLVWNTFMYKETVLFLTQPVYPSGIRLSRTPGVSDGQGGLACCRSFGGKQSDTTQQLN